MSTNVSASNRISGVALYAALFVLAVWLILLLFLVAHGDAAEVAWARWFTVTSSLEAVAFAAAGAIFGTTVQGQRVAEAKEQAVESSERAAKAENEASTNLQDAANGRALSTVIKKKKKGKKRKSESTEGFMSAHTEDADDDDDLVAIAESMFPD